MSEDNGCCIAVQHFQAGEPLVDGGGDDAAQLGPAADGERGLVHLDFAEGRLAQADHHAGDALVADQQVGAAAEDVDGQLFRMAGVRERVR